MISVNLRLDKNWILFMIFLVSDGQRGVAMAVFQLGPILKARREALGLSQEDLADGICAVPTLSRIENGERI